MWVAVISCKIIFLSRVFLYAYSVGSNVYVLQIWEERINITNVHLF